MRFRIILCIVLFCTGWINSYAQWDAQISQYWRVKSFFNPGFVTETDSLQATALHRQQWVGIINNPNNTGNSGVAPRTSIVTAGLPVEFLGTKHHVGAMFMSDAIGLFKNTYFGAQYAYNKKIKKSNLRIGVQLSVANISFDAQNIYIPQSEDHQEETIQVGEGSSTFDTGLGIAWMNEKYYIGLSALHLLEPAFEINENYTSYLSRTYYLTVGYNIKFKNPLYVLQPSLLVKSDGLFIQTDITARMVYNNLLNGGISWRTSDGFVFSLGITFKSFDAGYAYDLSTSAIAKASSGSHEIFLRYNMPMKFGKTEKKKHKSIRVL